MSATSASPLPVGGLEVDRTRLARSVDWWHHAVMGEIVNLRRARKQKAREAEAAEAAAKRAAFGESTAAREAREKREALEQARLEGARLDRSPPSHDES